MTTHLRGCARCAAFITTNDPTSDKVYCRTCLNLMPTRSQWEASLHPGNHVYLHPGFAWHGMSHSEHTVIARDGDQVTVQIVGLPESRRTVHVAHLAWCDVTPWTAGCMR